MTFATTPVTPSIRGLLGALLFTLAGWTGAASAQDWQSNSFDTGALIHGLAFDESRTVTLSCTAPSPAGRALIETGDHESLRTDTPYDLVVSFSVDFLSPYDGVSPNLPAPSLVIDGTRVTLPAMEYSDFYGAWTGWTRFDGPGILELFDARSLTVDTGTGTVRDFATDGLAAALASGLSPCLSRWVELGHALPPRLAAHINRNAEEPPQSSSVSAGAQDRAGLAPHPDWIPLRPTQDIDTAAISLTPPQLPAQPGQSMYDRAVATASQACGTRPELLPGAVWPGDIDGDGIEDVVFNWGFVSCGGRDYDAGLAGACDTAGQCRVTLLASALTARGLGDASLNAFHAEPEGEGLGLGRVHLTTREPFCGAAAGAYGCVGWLRLEGDQWQAAGLQPMNLDPMAVANAGSDTGSAPVSPGETPHQAFPIPDIPPQAALSYLYERCQGGFDLDPARIGSADFDADGLADYVLDWADMTCQGTAGARPFCGAANCLISIFLSTRNYADPAELLAIGFTMTTLPDGRPALLTSGTAGACQNGACEQPWFFDGQAFNR